MSRTVRRSRYRAGPAHHPLPPTVDAVGRNHLSPLPPPAADAAAVHIIALAESRLSLLPFWNLQAGKTKPIFLMLATEARFARYSSQIAYSESRRRAYQVLASSLEARFRDNFPFGERVPKLRKMIRRFQIAAASRGFIPSPD